MSVLAESDLALRTEQLRKHFGDRVAVAGMDLQVPRGSVFGFLGPNGSGKTTLIRMLVGLLRPSGGRAWLLGLPIQASSGKSLKRVGAIVEEPGFHPFLSGRQNLWIAAAARDTAAVARIDSVLGRVGLGDRGDDRVSAYSVGMRQRLGIARCLLSDPELLILDEPMNGLDPAGVREMRTLIRSFAEEGRTVFLSSHLLNELQRLCSDIAIVDAGRVVFHGRADEVLSGHALLMDVDDVAAAREVLIQLPVVRSVAVDRGGALRVRTITSESASVLASLAEAGVNVVGVESREVSLEDLFFELTSNGSAAS